jgi:CYTH domain-containing protein
MHKIEKKYLLKNSVNTLMNDLELNAQEVSEFYTVVKVCKEVKFSKIDSKYFKTIKNGIIGSIDQTRYKIKKARYIKEKRNSIGDKILKKRYLIANNGEKYFIDIYQKNLKNLFMLEIIFHSKKDFDKFILPEIFKEYIVKEVTSDKRYQNRNLALLGNPKQNPYNIYALFKDIEYARITNLDKTIFKEMKTSDSIRIVLYKLFIDLKINQDLIVQTKAEDGIKTFEKVLKKTIILLNEYKNIFDKKIVRNVLLHLKVMNKSLKTYNDLLFIQKNLTELENILEKSELDNIYKNIKHKISLEKHNISRFFTTREFAIIFKQYELLLKENNKSFLSIDGQTSINNTLREKIYTNYKKVIIKYDKYDGCEDIESYRIVNRPLKALIALLVEFKAIIDKDKYKTMYRVTNTASKEARRVKNINRRVMIINTYLESLDIKPSNYKQMLKKIDKQSKSDIAKKREKLDLSITAFKNKKDLFK